jgi:hypothetical protein
LQPHVLLHLHDLADRIVLDLLQLVRSDAICGEVLAGFQQPLRTQETADVIGPKRRFAARQIPPPWCAVGAQYLPSRLIVKQFDPSEEGG